NYANVSNVITTFGNIANVLFNNGNVTAAGGNGFFIGNGSLLTGITATIPSIVTADIRGNIIGNYANVSNVIATFGNIANVLFNNGNVTAAGGNGFFIGNGSLLTGITATIPSIVTADIRGNIIGNYANVSNVITTFGNIANVLFNNGNVTAAGGNGFFIGNGSLLTGITATATIPSIVTADIRGNIIGNYANVSNVIAAFGNIANVLFNNGNVTAAGGRGFLFGNGAFLSGIEFALPSIISEDIRGNIIGNYANVGNVIAGNINSTFGNIANVAFNNGNVTALSGNGYFFGNGTFIKFSTITADVNGNIIGNYANVANVIAGNVTATFGNIANVTFDNNSITSPVNITSNGNISVGTGGVFRGSGISNNAIVFRGSGGPDTNNQFSIGAPSGQMRFSIPQSTTAYYNFLNGTDTVATLGPQGFLSRSFDSSVNVGQVVSNSTTYSGSIFRTEANRNGSVLFNHIICSGSNGNVFRVRGDGTTYGVGAFQTSGADYAEMMEWGDKNPNSEDRRGYPVVLTGKNKIRIATPSDDYNDIIGVVSSNPSILADVAWDQWEGKYLKDKFGTKLSNVLYYLANISNENEFIRVGPMTTPPPGYFIKTDSEFILNPKYDPSIPYEDRLTRREWDPVGFVGKVRLRPGTITNPSWKQLRIIDDDKDPGNAAAQVIEYLVGVGSTSATAIPSVIRADLLGNVTSIGEVSASSFSAGGMTFNNTGINTNNSSINTGTGTVTARTVNLGTNGTVSVDGMTLNSSGFSSVLRDTTKSFIFGGNVQINMSGSMKNSDGSVDVMRVRGNTFTFGSSRISNDLIVAGSLDIGTPNTSSEIRVGAGNVVLNGTNGVSTFKNIIDLFGGLRVRAGDLSVSENIITERDIILKGDIRSSVGNLQVRLDDRSNFNTFDVFYGVGDIKKLTVGRSTTVITGPRAAVSTTDPTCVIHAPGGAYTGDTLRITSIRDNSRSDYNHIKCRNSTSDVFRVDGIGNVYQKNSISNGADYAEMFQWNTPPSEDTRGKTVVLSGSYIRLSTPADDPLDIFGVVSSNPCIIGDVQWNQWRGKYIKNKFDEYITENKQYVSNISDETDRVEYDGTSIVQDGYEVITVQELKLNPLFDERKEYKSREERGEWVPIGMVGKLRVLPGQVVNPAWQLLRTIDAEDGQILEYCLSTASAGIKAMRDKMTILEDSVQLLKKQNEALMKALNITL
ncbi:Chlorovirus glycoprotein repeat domain-containing protein, partial [Paramecium bursaria Chlorella virus KS1B]